MSQHLTLDQGLVGILNAVTVAQQRGAFNLQEAATVFQAFTVVEAFQRQRQQASQAATTTSHVVAPPTQPVVSPVLNVE